MTLKSLDAIEAEDLEHDDEEEQPSALDQAREYLRYLRSPFVIFLPFLVIYGAFGYVWYTADQQEAILNERIDDTQFALRRPMGDAERAELELRGWTLALEQAKTVRVPRLLDADLVERTLETADAHQVIVSQATLRPEDTQVIDGNRYEVKSFTLRASGSLPDIEAFLDAMEGGAFEALTIQNTTVSGDAAGYSLSLTASAYSQPRPPGEDETDPGSGSGSSVRR